MKGQLIAQELNKMVWVSNNNGSEFACYLSNNRKVESKEDLSEKEQKSCMNLNAVLGDSW